MECDRPEVVALRGPLAPDDEHEAAPVLAAQGLARHDERLAAPDRQDLDAGEDAGLERVVAVVDRHRHEHGARGRIDRVGDRRDLGRDRLRDALEMEQGRELVDAVISAASVRARPIALTAVAAMTGAFFILDDPIFNGLAVSLIFGILVSTALTLVVIPILYYSYRNRRPATAGVQ